MFLRRSLAHNYKFHVVIFKIFFNTFVGTFGGASSRVASFDVLGARPPNLPTDKSIIIVQT